MSLSYSFHISSKKNAIANSKNLVSAFKHNLRAYDSNKYEKNVNDVLIGSDNVKNAMLDFKKIINQEFSKEVQDFNSTKTKTRDKITDYFEHVSTSKKTDLATEIIIQVGDKDFWDTKNLEEKKKMTSIFKNQISKLNKICPNFKIVNAVIHYDEASPHMQIIGIPVGYYEKGLKKRISKAKIFTKTSLEILQDKMREDVEREMKYLYGQDINLTAKQKGRNLDLLIPAYVDIMKRVDVAKEELKEQQNLIYQTNKIIDKYENFKSNILKIDNIKGKEQLFNKDNVIISKKDLIYLKKTAKKENTEILKYQNKNKELEQQKTELEFEKKNYTFKSLKLDKLIKAHVDTQILLYDLENERTLSSNYLKKSHKQENEIKFLKDKLGDLKGVLAVLEKKQEKYSEIFKRTLNSAYKIKYKQSKGDNLTENQKNFLKTTLDDVKQLGLEREFHNNYEFYEIEQDLKNSKNVDFETNKYNKINDVIKSRTDFLNSKIKKKEKNKNKDYRDMEL